MLRRLVNALQPLFLILAVLAIGWFLADQWPALRAYPWRLDWGWLLATVLLTLASWGVEIGVWQHLLALLGGRISFWVAARIWFLSAIVRYIPGSVWQPLSLTLYSRRHGVSPEITITSIVLFQVVMLLSTIPILILYFVRLDTQSLAAQAVGNLPLWLLWGALLPVLAFLLRPQWLAPVLNWVLSRIGRPPLALQLTSGKLLALIFVYFLNWLLWGGSFAAFTFAVAGEGVGDPATIAPLLIASFPIASVAGFLSLITPSGFGVREGAFYLLLTPQIAGSVVTVIALGMRAWGVVSELLLALISALFEKGTLDVRLEPTGISQTALAPNAVSPDAALPEPGIAPDLTRARQRKSI